MNSIEIEIAKTGLFHSKTKKVVINDLGNAISVCDQESNTQKPLKYTDISHVWIIRHTLNGVLQHHSIRACVNGREEDVVRSGKNIPESVCNAVVALIRLHNPGVRLTCPEVGNKETKIAKIILMCLMVPVSLLISSVLPFVLLTVLGFDPRTYSPFVRKLIGITSLAFAVGVTTLVCRQIWRHSKVTPHHRS